MATNIVYDNASQLSLTVEHPTAPVSGIPVRLGPLTGVALTDEGDGGNAATKTTVMIGIFVADVLVDDDVGSGIAEGDEIYYQDTATGSPTTNLNNNSTTPEAFFGIALEAVGAAATTRIKVLHFPCR